jgi:hypothetical protein
MLKITPKFPMPRLTLLSVASDPLYLDEEYPMIGARVRVISEPLYKPIPAGLVARVEKSAPTAPKAPLSPLNLAVPL